jgi:glycosyltransferase involved in cell wall biosynthesis
MKQETSPQITLCIPALNEEKNLPGLMSNLSSYFEKFLIPYEVVFCLDPSHDQSQMRLEEAAQKDSRVQLLINSHQLGRARSLLKALQAAKAPYIATASVDLSTPLGDITKLLQNLAGGPAAIAFGTRVDKKESPFLTVSSKKNQLELTYLNILWEQKKRAFKDPFSSAFVFKKDVRESLLQGLKVSGWYLTPALQAQVLRKNIPSIEIPVYANSGAARNFSYWREHLRLFLWSLRGQGGQ